MLDEVKHPISDGFLVALRAVMSNAEVVASAPAIPKGTTLIWNIFK